MTKSPAVVKVLKQFVSGKAVLFYERPQYPKAPKTMTIAGNKYKVIGVSPYTHKKILVNELLIPAGTQCVFKLSDAGKQYLEE